MPFDSADEDIEEGALVVEYIGELIEDPEKIAQRQKELEKHPERGSYVFEGFNYNTKNEDGKPFM